MRCARLPASIALALLLASCGISEARLRVGLENAGIHPRMASCMADGMARRLSLAQLRRLGDLPAARGSASPEQFLRRVRSLRDPEIWAAASSSAALCASGFVRQGFGPGIRSG